MSKARGKILIIEDNMMLARTYYELLEHGGYEVLDIVKSAEEAFAAADMGSPDLLIADVSLNGPMDGIDAVKKITEKIQVPVILISGQSESDGRERMKNIPRHCFMMKPVDFDEMARVVKELLK